MLYLTFLRKIGYIVVTPVLFNNRFVVNLYSNFEITFNIY